MKDNKVVSNEPGQLGKAKFINIVDSGYRKTVCRFKKRKMLQLFEVVCTVAYSTGLFYLIVKFYEISLK